MKAETNKFLVIALMLLAFLSQSVAAVNLSCVPLSNDNQSTNMLMEGMDHSAHAMPGLLDTNQSIVDCCGQGDCSMSSCANSAVITATVSSLNSPRYASILNTEYNMSHLNPLLTSPFRPPINR